MPEPTPEARPPTFDELFDRGDRASVLKIAQDDADIDRQLSMQTEVDSGLRRLFGSAEVAAPAPVRRISSARWISWAAAAGVMLTIAGVWWSWSSRTGPDSLGPLYRVSVASGLTPETVCTTDEEFARWCLAYLRQPIYPISHPDGVEFVGWGIKDAPTNFTGVLLARYKGEPIVVAMNRVDRIGVITPGAIEDKQLHVHRKRVGDVVLYEVSLRKEPVVLPTLSARKPGK